MSDTTIPGPRIDLPPVAPAPAASEAPAPPAPAEAPAPTDQPNIVTVTETPVPVELPSVPADIVRLPTIPGPSLPAVVVKGAPTQVKHPTRAVVRTILAVVIGVATVTPDIVLNAHLSDTALGGQAVVVAAFVTRILAVPGVEVFLAKWFPWLSASPA